MLCNPWSFKSFDVPSPLPSNGLSFLHLMHLPPSGPPHQALVEAAGVFPVSVKSFFPRTQAVPSKVSLCLPDVRGPLHPPHTHLGIRCVLILAKGSGHLALCTGSCIQLPFVQVCPSHLGRATLPLRARGPDRAGTSGSSSRRDLSSRSEIRRK